MWLRYFPYFLRSVAQNMRFDNPNVDPNKEWPTRYCYLVYEAVGIHRSWIESLADFHSSSNAKLANRDLQYQADNPFQSAIISLCVCYAYIAAIDELPPRFLAYLTEIVLGVYFWLRANNYQEYSELFLDAFESGGTSYGPDLDITRVRAAFPLVDVIPWSMQDHDGWRIIRDRLGVKRR